MARNKIFVKKAISLTLCLLMLFSLIPQFSYEVNALTLEDNLNGYSALPITAGTASAATPYKVLEGAAPSSWSYDQTKGVIYGPNTNSTSVLANDIWGVVSGNINVSADVGFLTDTAGSLVGVAGRYSFNSALNRNCYYRAYLKRVSVSSKPGAQLFLERRNGSSVGTVSTAGFLLNANEIHNVKMEIIDNADGSVTVSAYLDNVFKLTLTDVAAYDTSVPPKATSTPLTSGKFGFFVYNGNTTSNVICDNLKLFSTPSISAPTGLTATLTGTQANLSWSAAAGASSYNIYKKTGNGSLTQTATGVTGTTYTDTGLLDGQTYTYSVRSVDSESNESLDSDTASVTLAPVAPTNLTAAAGDQKVTLSWDGILGATGYNIYRDVTANVDITKPKLTTVTGSVYSYIDTPLVNGTTYYYKVTAYNTANESPASAEASAVPVAPVTVPEAPANLTKSVQDDNITITWDAAANASSYSIKRSSTSGGPYTTLQTGINGTSYLDTGLSLGSYYYVVSASNSAGEGANSPGIKADVVLPNAPTALTATTPSSGKVSLTWSYTGAANGYNVYISSDNGASYAKSNTAILTTKSYSVSGLTNDTVYKFVVTVVNTVGESDYSVPVDATPKEVPAVILDNITPDNFINSLSSAPDGATLILSAGSYPSFSMADKNDITLKPAVGAKPLFAGSSAIYIKRCSNITIEGMEFSIDISGGANWLKITNSNHVQIKNNHFYSPAVTGTGSIWVFIGGGDGDMISHDNYIGYNLMENKKDTGKFIVLDGAGNPKIPSQNDVIEHNEFKNTVGRQTNESEPIRLGVSDLTTYDAHSIVQYNTFYHTDSDPEIISVKSCSDIIRYNKFVECLGTVCIRQSFNTEVYGNYFIGNGRKDGADNGTGGVRIYSNGHKVYNNYFEGLSGTVWDAAITMTDGDAVNPENAGTVLTSHFPAKNVIVANNTFVNNEHNFEIGFKNPNGKNVLSKPITNVSIVNNLVVGSKNELIKIMDQPVNLTLSGNIMFPQEGATLVTNPPEYDSYWNSLTSAQVRVVDPMLVRTGEYYKLTNGSPAIDTAIGDYSSTGVYGFITKDIDGDIRVPGAIDVGADEFVDSGSSDTTSPEWGNSSPLSVSAGTTSTTITISWTPATDASGISSYKVFKDGVPYATVYDATTYTVTGLTPNTTYLFKVVASDTKGNLSQDSNTVSETTLILVEPVITAIGISGLQSVPSGSSPMQTVITATYNDTSTKVITSGVTFTSSNTAVAEISPTGLVTPVGIGTTTITAVFGDLTPATYVLVVQGSSTTELSATNDAYVRQNYTGSDNAYADTNYGTAETMNIKNNGGIEYRDGFVQFDLTGISENTSKVTLKLGIASLDSNTVNLACDFSVYGLNDDNWSEATITFNNQPADVGILLGTATADDSSVGNYKEFDVTDFVLSQTDGKVTFRIRGATSGKGFKLVTKESTTSANKPLLIVLNVQDDGGTPATGVNLNKTSADMNVGSNLQLTATIVPEGADGSVTWSSSDSSIVSVAQNGTVTAKAEGTAKVIATVSEAVYAECTIRVTAVNVPPVIIEQPPVPVNNSKISVTANEFNNELAKVSGNDTGIKTVQFEIKKVEGAKSYEITLPADALTKESLKHNIAIKTPIATAVLPSNMLAASQVNGASSLTLSVELVDKKNITDKSVLDKVGNRPVLDISLKMGDKVISYRNPDAPLSISIPYTPTGEELKNPEKIIVYYINNDGKVEKVPSGRYDAATGMVTFKTTHLSEYTISYDNKTFTDLDNFSWAKKEIEVLASKGIINGTSDTNYSPSENITRADFIVLLVKALGLTSDFSDNFSDVKSSDYYYNALGIAKKLGISKGSGNNLFNPNESISRQDMMVLTSRALNMVKIIDVKGTTADIAKFSDKASVSDYAAIDVATMVKAGIITGDGSNLNPLGNANRAETAVIMYRIYNKQ